MAKKKKAKVVYSGQVNFIMDRGMHRALGKLAKKSKVTIPELIRRTLEAMLEEAGVSWKEEGVPNLWNEKRSNQQRTRLGRE